MNLLISSGVFHPAKGGAESLLLDLSRGLAARGHAVTVVTRRLPGTAERERLPHLEIVRYRFPMPYERMAVDRALVLGSPAILGRLWSLLRDRRISTVCVGLLDMSVVYLLALRHVSRFRLVLYLHGGETRGLPRESRAYRRLLRRCLAVSDAVVAVSPALKEEAARAWPPARDRITVIENAVDVAAIAAARTHRAERPYILFAGRLVRDKNVATILEAFARATPRLPAVDLIVAGSGPEEAGLRRRRAELGLSDERVRFTGPLEREAVFAYMKGALFLVLASVAEGHPIVGIEARVAGIPVIGPRVTGIADTIEPGVDGALYPPGDRDALAELMVRYAGDREALASLRTRIASIDPDRHDLRHVLDRHERILAGGP